MSNDSWDSFREKLLSEKERDKFLLPNSVDKGGSKDNAPFEIADPETGNIFNTRDETYKPFGSLSRGLVKVPGQLSDLPFTGHNLLLSLQGDKDPKETMYHKLSDQYAGDPESGMQFGQRDLSNVGPLTTGLTEKSLNLFDKLTGDRFKPEDKIDEFYEGLGSFLGSSFLPGGTTKLIKGAGKAASKALPFLKNIGEGVSSGVSKVMSKLSPGVQESLEETGKAGKKLFDFMTTNPSKGQTLTGLGSEWAADALESGLDMSDPKQRALAILSRPIIGVGGSQASNAGKNLATSALLKNIISEKKLKTLSNPELGIAPTPIDVIDTNTARGDVLRTLTTQSMKTPLGSKLLQGNLEKNIDSLADKLKVKKTKPVETEKVSKILKKSGDKYFEEISDKERQFSKKYTPAGEAPPLKDILSKDKTFDSLPASEQGKVYTKFLQEKHGKGNPQVPTGKQLEKELNDFTKEMYGSEKNFKTVKIFDPEKKETIQIKVQESPSPHYVSLPKTTKVYEELVSGKHVPAYIKDRLKGLKNSNGLLEFGQLDNLRQDLNSSKIPAGLSTYSEKNLNAFRKAIKTDEVNHFRKFGLDEKAFHDRNRYFRKDVFQKTPKDITLDVWKDAMRSPDKKELFKEALGDVSKGNKMQNIYLNNLNQKEASKVLSSYLTDIAFDTNNKVFDFNKFRKYYRDLDKDKQHFWQKLVWKANGNKKIHIQQMMDAIDIFQDTYRDLGSRNSSSLNRLLYKQIPEEVQKASSLLSVPSRAGWGAVKMVLPYFILNNLERKMVDPKFLTHLVEGSKIKGKGHFLSWLNKGYEHKMLSKADFLLLQNAINKKTEKNNDK